MFEKKKKKRIGTTFESLLLLLLTIFFEKVTVAQTIDSPEQTEQQYLRRDNTIKKSSTSSTTPVFGILAQPSKHVTGDNQYIAASYIKWLEAGGARAIPIPYDAIDVTFLDDLFSQMNGLFLPGGASELPFAIEYLLHKAVESNTKDHIYFPVWGTCLGFEFLIQYFGSGASREDIDVLESGYTSENISLPLEQVGQEELYADDYLYDTVLNYNVTMNNHKQGISPSRFFNNSHLPKLFHVTSTNQDDTGRPFVSTIEPIHKSAFPIYGVQYHPEKNAFEYATYPDTNIPYEAIDHSERGIQFSMALAQFVVNLARTGQKSQFTSHEYNKSSVYPTVTAYPIQTGLAFEEIFIIPPASHWPLPPTIPMATAIKKQKNNEKKN